MVLLYLLSSECYQLFEGYPLIVIIHLNVISHYASNHLYKSLEQRQCKLFLVIKSPARLVCLYDFIIFVVTPPSLTLFSLINNR